MLRFHVAIPCSRFPLPGFLRLKAAEGFSPGFDTPGLQCLGQRPGFTLIMAPLSQQRDGAGHNERNV